MRLVIILIPLFILISLTTSCSHSTNPTTPPVINDISLEQSSTSNVDCISSNRFLNTKGVMGAWYVLLDIANMKAEIAPARNAQAIGNIFDADLSQFLTVSPCTHCLSIAGMYFDGYGNLNLKVRMKHPFGNPATRPDLHGFDVRGIFIVPATTTDANIKVMDTSGTEQNANCTLDLILNPDGMTSHFDELPTDPRYFIGGSDVTGNLNPFFRFFEDYATPTFDPHAPDGHNVMPVGSGHYDRTVVFNQKYLTDYFGFYIIADVAYGQSATLANRTNPQYYLPAFHRTEAWRAEYWIENNNLTSYSPTSTADVVVQVFDWQHGVTVDPDYPDPSNLSGIPENSDVLRLELSIPQLQNAPVVTSTPEIGYGTPTNPLRYRLTITNENRAYYNPIGLLAIRDNLYGQASPHGRMPIPESPSGFPYETNDIRDYTLYIPITVNIINGSFGFDHYLYGYNTFDWNTLLIPYKDQFATENGSVYQTVMHPWYFRDAGHKKFQYRWDYDYDGVTFNEDGGGAPSPTIEFATPGRKNIGLRIRDNAVPARENFYEIPVFAEGTAFRETIPSSEWNRDTPSSSRGQAVDVTTDNFYMVYSHEAGGTRDIWLAIIDRQGNISRTQITNTTDICCYPSIEVIEYGTNEGVYIVYSRVIDFDIFLYATHGNLDGTGFSPANNKRITSAAGPINEVEACIINDFLRLNVFYTRWTFPLAIHVCGAYSSDYGDTWHEYGRVANNGSDAQQRPTATSTSYRNSTLIFEEWKDDATKGADLYRIEINNGQYFESPQCVSIFHDDTDEFAPSCSYGAWQIAIAYVAMPDGSSERRARLKVLSPEDDTHFDFPIDHGTGANIAHTFPSVDSGGDNNFTYSFGSYNMSTNELTCNILHLHKGVTMNMLDIEVLLEESVGTVSAGVRGEELYPGVVCSRPIGSAIENFVVFRNYTSGSFLSPNSPMEVFGQIDTIYIVTECFETD